MVRNESCMYAHREFKTYEGGNLFPLILEIAGEKNVINFLQ